MDKYLDIIKKEFDVNDEVLDSLNSLNRCEAYEYEDKGFFLYMIMDGFTNKKEMMELFIYLYPEHRTFRNMNNFLKKIEVLAKNKACDIIKISSNSGHKDKVFIKYLQRKGYLVDTVYKEIT